MTLTATLDVDIVDGVAVFELHAENTGDTAATVQFPTGQTVDVTVREADSETLVWRWSDGQLFAQTLREQTVRPGETIRETVRWETPQAGDYVAHGTLTADARPTAETTFSV
ncbi:BsuPI-related putative proteinase inhibitor [Halovenus rubra]|uniref:Intracellular proteinase inhibitor BsuPI domain-containing protein n=2 Tax=Halovenus rubra TaxID=869890 RepID=A0ABD5X006_9EURY|nr:BsuPI-related putative proteinase inhibitor [Halovenus rubra]